MLTRGEIEKKLDDEFAKRRAIILQNAANKLAVYQTLKDAGFPVNPPDDLYLTNNYAYDIKLTPRQVAEARKLLKTELGEKELGVYQSSRFLVSLPLKSYPGVRLQYVRDQRPEDKCRIHREMVSGWSESVVCSL